MFISEFISTISAAIFAAAGVYCCRGVARKARIGPIPTARSMHQEFTPLLGGVGIFIGILAGIGVAVATGSLPVSVIRSHQFFFMGWALIFLTGLLDDLRSLPFWIKFILQLMAAFALVFNGCVIEAFVAPPDEAFLLGAFSIPFTVLWIVFVINAINLLDGLDGLAGGVSVIALVGFAAIAALQGSHFLIVLAFIAAGSVVGFLNFNRFPATIFMGDAGSLQLGYLLAFLSIEAFRVAGSHHVLFLSAIVLLGLPLSDTLMAFFRRLSQGKSPFHPDKQHVHHRLLHLGISHPATVNLLYLIQAILTLLAILMVLYRDLTVYLLFALFLILAIYWMKRLGFLEQYQQFSRVAMQKQNPGVARAAVTKVEEASAKPLVPIPLNLNRLWHQVLLFLGDAVAIIVSILLFFWIRNHMGVPETGIVRHWKELFQYPVMVYAILLWTVLFWLNGLYDLGWDVSRYEHIARLTRVIAFGIVVLGFVTSDLKIPSTRSQWFSLGAYGFIMVGFTGGIRLLIIAFEKHWNILEYAPKPTLFIGFSRRMADFLEDVRMNPHLLYDIQGIVTVGSPPASPPLPILGNIDQLPEIIVRQSIKEAVVDLPEQFGGEWMKAIAICDRLNVTIRTFPGMAHLFSGGGRNYSSYALITLLPKPMVQWQWLVKRSVDVGLSALGMILVAPFLSVWGVVQTVRKSPVMTHCPVLGKLGLQFPMHYLHLPVIQNICTQPEISGTKSRFQMWLFRTRLYKIPQLINVLRGEMSWVGPRPEPAEWYQKLEERVPFVYRRLFVRPGITGLGQMRYRYEHSQKAQEARIRSDIFYIENMSLRMDFQILLRSAWIFLFERNRRRQQ